MWNGRVVWEKLSSAGGSANAASPGPAPNENAPSGENGNTFDASPESSPPEFESSSPPNLPSPTPATGRTVLKTLWNGGIKNSGSEYCMASLLVELVVIYLLQ